MRRVVLELGLFEPICGGNIAWSEMTLMPLLEMAAWANVVHMRCNPSIPKLYDAVARGAVRYKQENGERPGEEPFYSVYEILKRGGSDCNNLCPWRVAELRMFGDFDRPAHMRQYPNGEPAGFRIIKFQRPGKALLYHVQVRRAPTRRTPNPMDLRLIEDPSAIAGMPIDGAPISTAIPI